MRISGALTVVGVFALADKQKAENNLKTITNLLTVANDTGIADQIQSGENSLVVTEKISTTLFGVNK